MHMRAAIVAMWLVAAAYPVFGASMKNHDDCGAGAADRVITACTRIIKDRSETQQARATAHVNRGLARQHQGQRYKAMVDYTAAIQLNPNDPLAYSNRAILWHEKQDFDRAIADLTEAIRIDPMPRSDQPVPGSVNLHYNRGLAWRAKGDLDRALADFDRAISLDPKDAEAFYQRALVHYLHREFERAIADMTEAASLAPDNPDISAMLEDLKQGLSQAKERQAPSNAVGK